MKIFSKNSNRSYLTDRFILKYHNPTTETFYQNGSPVPFPRYFFREMIDPFRVGSSFNETNQERFIDTNETKNMRRGVPGRDIPTVSTNNISTNHKQTMKREDEELPE